MCSSRRAEQRRFVNLRLECERRTGARMLARSSAVEDDLLVLRQSPRRVGIRRSASVRALMPLLVCSFVRTQRRRLAPPTSLQPATVMRARVGVHRSRRGPLDCAGADLCPRRRPARKEQDGEGCAHAKVADVEKIFRILFGLRKGLTGAHGLHRTRGPGSARERRAAQKLSERARSML